jgi:hypothetical protein
VLSDNTSTKTLGYITQTREGQLLNCTEGFLFCFVFFFDDIGVWTPVQAN